MTTKITVENIVNVPVEKAWEYWTKPEHITKWNQASEDWHTPRATNDLRVGGKFTSRMEAKDGSMGFDFEGTYTTVNEHKLINYVMADGREVSTEFKDINGHTHVKTVFDAETINPVEMQQTGWQSILNSYKKYTENN